jgi:hypothetical protein
LRIQLLRKRENFLEIFQKSISAFCQEKYSHADHENIDYIINDYLNIIYPSKINRNDLADLVGEFKYHRKFYRRILQSIYTFLAIRWPFEAILSSGVISISLPCNINERWVFIPGNHSIRIVALDKNRCFVFLKTGFNKKFIDSDANIRLMYPWLKSPKVFQQKNTWYEEQRVIGLPWNRLSSDDLKKKIIIKAQNQLSKLYRKTIISVPVADYVPQLCSDIISLLNTSFSSLSDDDKAAIDNFVSEQEFLLENYFDDKNIDLVETHGDFQPGNILCSENDFWIIDWEYSDQRSIFYDALVFDLECRFPSGLSMRLDKKINELSIMRDYLRWTSQSLDDKKIHYFSIFFLEDLLLRMGEISVESIQAKSEALSTYLAELVAIQKILIEHIKN